jgi:hypothetical protein
MSKSNYAEVDESNISDSDKEIGLLNDPTITNKEDIVNNSFYASDIGLKGREITQLIPASPLQYRRSAALNNLFSKLQ